MTEGIMEVCNFMAARYVNHHLIIFIASCWLQIEITLNCPIFRDGTLDHCYRLHYIVD